MSEHTKTLEEIYGDELDKTAGILERLHPSGSVRQIGRRQVAVALEDVANLHDRLVAALVTTCSN